MTQAQLQRLCLLWQRRLRLQDWDVTVSVEPMAEMSDIEAQIPLDCGEMKATLRLREDKAEDPEPWIVHELIHLRLLPFSLGEDDEPEHEARETAVNLLADCFVRAYPRRRK